MEYQVIELFVDEIALWFDRYKSKSATLIRILSKCSRPSTE
jgi:hypothetical protein